MDSTSLKKGSPQHSEKNRTLAPVAPSHSRRSTPKLGDTHVSLYIASFWLSHKFVAGSKLPAINYATGAAWKM